jgi:hypothetical protein
MAGGKAVKECDMIDIDSFLYPFGAVSTLVEGDLE